MIGRVTGSHSALSVRTGPAEAFLRSTATVSEDAMFLATTTESSCPCDIDVTKPPREPSRFTPVEFLPSPEDIAAECQSIQAEWSEDERYRRALGRMRETTTKRIEPIQSHRRQRE